MIDIHSHILPCLDDGPDDIETSIKMAASYAEAGFSAVVATPHLIMETRWAYHPLEIINAVTEFQEMLDQRLIPVRIYPGMEVAVSNVIFDKLNLSDMMPLAASKYYLIEPPMNVRLGCKWEEFADKMRLSGKGVILSHPERCLEFQSDLMRIPALVKKSRVFVQVNMGSLNGVFGNEAMKAANYMLENGYVHFLASDSHDVHRRRPPAGTDLELLRQRYGEKALKMFFEINPYKMIASGEIDPVLPDFFYQEKGTDIVKKDNKFYFKKFLKNFLS